MTSNSRKKRISSEEKNANDILEELHLSKMLADQNGYGDENLCVAIALKLSEITTDFQHEFFGNSQFIDIQVIELQPLQPLQPLHSIEDYHEAIREIIGEETRSMFDLHRQKLIENSGLNRRRRVGPMTERRNDNDAHLTFTMSSYLESIEQVLTNVRNAILRSIIDFLESILIRRRPILNLQTKKTSRIVSKGNLNKKYIQLLPDDIGDIIDDDSAADEYIKPSSSVDSDPENQSSMNTSTKRQKENHNQHTLDRVRQLLSRCNSVLQTVFTHLRGDENRSLSFGRNSLATINISASQWFERLIVQLQELTPALAECINACDGDVNGLGFDLRDGIQHLIDGLRNVLPPNYCNYNADVRQTRERTPANNQPDNNRSENYRESSVDANIFTQQPSETTSQPQGARSLFTRHTNNVSNTNSNREANQAHISLEMIENEINENSENNSTLPNIIEPTPENYADQYSVIANGQQSHEPEIDCKVSNIHDSEVEYAEGVIAHEDQECINKSVNDSDEESNECLHSLNCDEETYECTKCVNKVSRAEEENFLDNSNECMSDEESSQFKKKSDRKRKSNHDIHICRQNRENNKNFCKKQKSKDFNDENEPPSPEDSISESNHILLNGDDEVKRTLNAGQHNTEISPIIITENETQDEVSRLSTQDVNHSTWQSTNEIAAAGSYVFQHAESETINENVKSANSVEDELTRSIDNQTSDEDLLDLQSESDSEQTETLAVENYEEIADNHIGSSGNVEINPDSFIVRQPSEPKPEEITSNSESDVKNEPTFEESNRNSESEVKTEPKHKESISNSESGVKIELKYEEIVSNSESGVKTEPKHEHIISNSESGVKTEPKHEENSSNIQLEVKIPQNNVSQNLLQFALQSSITYRPANLGKSIWPDQYSKVHDKIPSSDDSSSLTTEGSTTPDSNYSDEDFKSSAEGSEDVDPTSTTTDHQQQLPDVQQPVRGKECQSARLHQKKKKSGKKDNPSSSSSSSDDDSDSPKSRNRKSKRSHPRSEKRHKKIKYFTLAECKELQRIILDYSRNNDNLITEISFDMDEVTVVYLLPGLKKDESDLMKDLVDALGLEERQIKLYGSEKSSCVRRTCDDYPSCMGETRSWTVYGAFICVKYTGETLLRTTPDYILTCGHDKSEDGHFSSQFCLAGCTIAGKIEHALFLDNDNSKYSIDAALVTPHHTTGIRPYVYGKYDINGNGVLEDVRIYIKSALKFDDNDKAFKRFRQSGQRVQTYEDGPFKGKVVAHNCVVEDTADRFFRPIYNVLKVTTLDGKKAIHGKGESGLLMTTAVDISKISSKRFSNGRIEYYTFVRAVGILVANQELNIRGQPVQYSLDLQADKTLNDLLDYMKKKQAPDRFPSEIGFFISEEVRSTSLIHVAISSTLVHNLPNENQGNNVVELEID